jgi:hypothetical protein
LGETRDAIEPRGDVFPETFESPSTADGALLTTAGLAAVDVTNLFGEAFRTDVALLTAGAPTVFCTFFADIAVLFWDSRGVAVAFGAAFAAAVRGGPEVSTSTHSGLEIGKLASSAKASLGA